MLKHTSTIAFAFFAAASFTPAVAQTASSSGYAVEVDQTVAVPRIANVNVTVAPVAPAGGSAAPSYDTTNTVLSLNQNAALTTGLLGIGGIGEHLGTGVLTTNVNGTLNGAEATSTIDNFSFGVAGLTSLLGLNATTIQSYSQANSAGGLDASGSTTLEGLNFGGTLLGSLLLNGNLYVNPNPNTVLVDLLGLTIVLNEQITIGDGISGLGIGTNAIHIGFNNFALGTGILNGDIIIGHTEAFATIGAGGSAPSVPEPATWAMMLLGFGIVGMAIRRRRKWSPAMAA